MPIIDKNDKNNWYHRIPTDPPRETAYNPFADPDFDISRMKENEFRQPDGTVVAKIPVLEGRIYRRQDHDRKATYIVLLADAYYDKAKGQMRNEKVILGTAIGAPYEGLMIVNQNYHKYFDTDGRLIHDPLKRRKDQEAKEKEQKEQEKAKNKTNHRTNTKTSQATNKEIPKEHKDPAAEPTQSAAAKDEERTVDEIKASLLEKEKKLDEKLKMAEESLKELQEVQEQLDRMQEARQLELAEKERAHIDLLESILSDYITTVRNQAKSKPDKFMRAAQIQTINRILSELRDYFSGSNAEDYLQLAPEPEEQDLANHPGTTYGEMDLLLSAYINTIHTFRYGHLYYKN